MIARRIFSFVLVVCTIFIGCGNASNIETADNVEMTTIGCAQATNANKTETAATEAPEIVETETPQAPDMDADRIRLIETLIEIIETRDDGYYCFRLEENGFGWYCDELKSGKGTLQLEYDILNYCAGEYELDRSLVGRLRFTYAAKDYSYIGMENFEQMRETIELSRQEGERQAFVQTRIKEAVERLDLNGDIVHDLKEVHDYVCGAATYPINADASSYGYYNSLYVFFSEGKAVCGGYAKAFQAICDYIGIDVRYERGTIGATNTIAHAWNSVEINGVTYYIDCTWDDTEGTEISYKYFLTTTPSGVAY